jgi:hypothetical protein
MEIDKMTPEELAEIEARAEAAAAGPWNDSGRGFRTDIGYCMDREDGERVLIPLFETRTNAKRADIVFVTHARTDIPALIAEVKRLQQQIEANHAAAAEYIYSLENQR